MTTPTPADLSAAIEAALDRHDMPAVVDLLETKAAMVPDDEADQ